MYLNVILSETWTWAWTWWGFIVGINVINLTIGILFFIKSLKNNKDTSNNYKRNMRIAGLIFIGVAFYRSIFISNYLNQLAWFDTLLNSTLLIRSFALFAELSFAYLIMKLILQTNKDIPIEESHKSNRLLHFLELKAPIYFFVFIAIANVFAYGGSITKVHLLFAIEETFWGLGFLLITPVVLLKTITVVKDKTGTLKQFYYPLLFLAVFCVGYSFYSVFYHLPIEYWPQAIEQLQVSNPEPAFQFGFQAIADTFKIVNVTRDYATWGGLGFVIWHSGYFTLCGWMVLLFMTGPEKKNIKHFNKK